MKLQLALAAAVFALQGPAFAAPVPITGTTTYTQNFDSLGTGSPAWTNDSTIPGWYAQINNGTTATGSAQATSGAADLSGLLNCGSGVERALGSKATGTNNFANIAMAISFQNTSANAVALSSLQYTGELWRSNSVANTAESFTVFYQVSNSAVTNILSGPNSATAAAGTGFTALGAAANWSLANAGAGVALDGNAAANRVTVSFSPSSIVLAPGQFLMIKWTDTNVANTDGFQALDDVSVGFTQVAGLLTPTVSNLTRDFKGTFANPADDTFGFTLNVAGTGAVSATWTTSDAQPPASNAATGAYGAPVVWTGFPIPGPKTVTVSDSVTATLNAAFSVNAPQIIGTNDLVAAGTPLVTNGAAVTGWQIDETLPTASQTGLTVQEDHVVFSRVVDLSTIGFAYLTADLDAIAGTSSGFELADHFGLDVIIDGGAPVSVLGAADTNSDGLLSGQAAGLGNELPDAGVLSTTKTFPFAYLIPPAANSVQIRITGNSNSGSETLILRSLKLSNPPAMLSATPAGPVTLNNNGTADPVDDTFSAPVNVYGVSLGASPGWHSNEVPPRTGLYTAPNPVTFGPYPITGGAKSVILTDNLNAAAQASLTFSPPVTTLTVSAATNIVRHENGPGTADDTVTFNTTITAANGGPGWTTTGATPVSGAYGPVTFTVPAGPATTSLVIADVSYPAVTQTLNVTLPTRYTFGFQYYGGALLDLNSLLDSSPPVEWINDPVARTLDMNTGGTSDKVVLSDVVDLTARGTVYFSAVFRALETSTGSNFETTDRFKAELIIDGTTTVNLVSTYDTGNGATAVLPTGGPNGAPDGYINGYSGAAGTDYLSGTAYAAGADDYNANRVRDEFNRSGVDVAGSVDHQFLLSHTIPASANSVQLRITGAGVSASEFFTVSRVLFSTVSPTADTDNDGVSDYNELVAGTDPANPSSVFGITGLTPDAGNPGTVLAAFPTVAGRLYQGYYSTDLATWVRDDSHPAVSGNGSPATWPLTPAPAPGARHHLRVIPGFTASDFPLTLP